MSKKEAGSTDYFTDSIVMPQNSGKGVKVGTWSENSADTASFGWRDITSQVTVRGVGSNDPTWTRVGSTAFYTYAFAVGDECWMAFHVPHDIVPNADIHIHTHWFPSGTSTGDVSFQYTYSFAKGFDQEAFDFALANSPLTTAGTVTATSAGPGVQYQHMVTETAGISIPGLDEPDGIIYVHISRVATSPTNTDTIFVLTNDVHYQSTNLATVNKAPGFYG